MNYSEFVKYYDSVTESTEIAREMETLLAELSINLKDNPLKDKIVSLLRHNRAQLTHLGYVENTIYKEYPNHMETFWNQPLDE